MIFVPNGSALSSVFVVITSLKNEPETKSEALLLNDTSHFFQKFINLKYTQSLPKTRVSKTVFEGRSYVIHHFIP